MAVPIWLWLFFAAIVLVSLTTDLIVHRHGRGSSRRSAIVWSAIWIGVALGFGLLVADILGRDKGEDFLTAYLVEKSLSIDNLFVFLVVFSRTRMNASEQHRVLFWGILGALVFRGIFIAAGSAVIARWHEIIYVLGLFLIYTGIKAARSPQHPPTESRFVRVLRDRMHLHSPFALAVATIELTDIMFALDSVPAVFAITADPFIVYTSNVFALLGLRALFLVLSDLLGKIRYIHYGLASILVIAGLKMLTSDLFHVPHLVSLAAIAVILALTIVASLVIDRKPRQTGGLHEGQNRHTE